MCERITACFRGSQVFTGLPWQAAATEDVGMPFFFEFMTLLALRIFIEEKVDVAILEVSGQRMQLQGEAVHGVQKAWRKSIQRSPSLCSEKLGIHDRALRNARPISQVGIGGRKDATNIMERPTACGIAALGYDHMEILGDTLPQVAASRTLTCDLLRPMRKTRSSR